MIIASLLGSALPLKVYNIMPDEPSILYLAREGQHGQGGEYLAWSWISRSSCQGDLVWVTSPVTPFRARLARSGRGEVRCKGHLATLHLASEDEALSGKTSRDLDHEFFVM
jgi:hypothetical protein